MASILNRLRSPLASRAALAAVVVAAFLIGAGVYVQSTLAAPAQISEGSLEWGLRASFRNYVVGPIAHGSISTGGGATQAGNNGVFSFPVRSGTYDPDTGTLSVSFQGSVHFEGHDYDKGPLLDLEVSNLRIELNGSSGALIGDVSSRSLESISPDADLGPIVEYEDVVIANLSGASVQAGNGFSWSGISASLASSGVEAFGGFYQAGEGLDPVSITIETEAVSTPTPSATATPVPGTPTPVPTATAVPVASTQVSSETAALEGSSEVQSDASITAPSVGDAGLAAGR